jgi:hypothetical protein
MGKTTFSRHLGAVLAEKALADSVARIPILIPLGMISAEQTLGGLLGVGWWPSIVDQTEQVDNKNKAVVRNVARTSDVCHDAGAKGNLFLPVTFN